MTRRRSAAGGLKVLALVEPSLVPPDDPQPVEVRDAAAWRMEYDVVSTLRGLGHEVVTLGVGGDLGGIRNAVHDFNPDVAFNLLEGFDDDPGFDTNMVAYLELLRLRYTGCNSRGLLLARDKPLAKKLLTYHRVPVPEFFVVPRGHRIRRPKRLEFPLIVKSRNLDSSIGISQASVVESDAKLEERVRFMHESVGTDALVERFVDGREMYVSILGNDRLNVLPIWELLFTGLPEESHRIATERLKWNARYQERRQIESGPVEDLDPAVAQRIVNVCKRAYRILRLNGYARMDLRVTASGQPFLLEANPNPQIAHDEEFAESANEGGIVYPELIGRILALAMRWEPRRWS